jgi:transposase-like protein
VSLAARRPARSLTAIATESAAGALPPDDLPRLPRGVTLDPAVLDGAACQTHPDPDLFFPDPGDTAAIAVAKRLCAACRVRPACLAMAVATGDQHAIAGGLTAAERAARVAAGQTTAARTLAARHAEATGVDLAAIRAAAAAQRRTGQGRPTRYLIDRAAAAVAYQLAAAVGITTAAAELGISYAALRAAFDRWGLPRPASVRHPQDTPAARLRTERTQAAAAMRLARQVGTAQAARRFGVDRKALRAAFDHWGLGRPHVKGGSRAPTRLHRDRTAAAEALELARQVGVRPAARQLGVCPRTLHNTWQRWQLGTVTSTPQGVRLARARRQDDPWHRANRARLAALDRAATSCSGRQPGPHRASATPARSGPAPERTPA